MRFLHIHIAIAAVFMCTTRAADTALPVSAPLAAKAGERLPGVDFAQGITEITGVAISPMLGVCSVGAWRYFNTSANLRARLPWYCNPIVWGIGMGIIALALLKDTAGIFLPSFFKKPFDMGELLESKFSALVASTAFVPLIASEMARHGALSPLPSAALSSHCFVASIVPCSSGFDLRLLFIPLGILSFLVVWMISHAINVLIVICPFGFIGAILKCIKAVLLSSVLVAYIINPYLGAAVSLLYIGIAAYFAPFTFRFTFFGTLLSTDILLPWLTKRSATPTTAHAFVANKAVMKLPLRTYGRVVLSEDGRILFSYRPCFIFPRQTVDLPGGDLAVEKGFLFPTLLQRGGVTPEYRKILIFLPRYRRHEQAIASHFGISDVRDSTLTKGLKAIRIWFNEAVNFGQQKIAHIGGAGNLLRQTGAVSASPKGANGRLDQ